MRRRASASRRKAAAARLLCACALASALACAEPQGGPQEIHWDRDTCAWCSMAIGDRRHAAQLRLAGERGAQHFDDPGCALLWLDARGASLADAEIWVRDPGGERWVDARAVRFREGERTPMGHGFATAEGGVGLTLAEVHARIRERKGDPRGLAETGAEG